MLVSIVFAQARLREACVELEELREESRARKFEDELKEAAMESGARPVTPSR